MLQQTVSTGDARSASQVPVYTRKERNQRCNSTCVHAIEKPMALHQYRARKREVQTYHGRSYVWDYQRRLSSMCIHVNTAAPARVLQYNAQASEASSWPGGCLQTNTSSSTSFSSSSSLHSYAKNCSKSGTRGPLTNSLRASNARQLWPYTRRGNDRLSTLERGHLDIDIQ